MPSSPERPRILVAASEERVESLSDLLRATGADVVPFPTVRIRPPEDRTRLDDALRRWRTYDWVVFTSTNGVDAVASRARDLRLVLARPPRIAVVGPATKSAAERAGFTVDAMPDEFITDAIAEALGPIAGQRILLPRSRLARKSLPQRLRGKGAHVDAVDAYDAARAAPDLTRLSRAAGIRLVVFTSGSTVENLVALLPHDLIERLRTDADAVCIGPATAEAARRNGFRVALVARDHTVQGVVREMREAIDHG